MQVNLYDQIDLAVEQIRKGDVQEGLAALNRLQAKGRHNPEILLELSDVYYDLGHVDTALSLLEKARPFWDDLPTEARLEAMLLRAEIRMDVGELDGAMEDLLMCLELEPNLTRASIHLADIYLMQNMPEVACKYLEGIVREDPNQDDVRYILAQIYLDAGEIEKGTAHLDLLESTKYADKVLLSRAKLLSQAGQFEHALQLYKESLQKESAPDALFGCALTSLQLGKYEQAVQYGSTLLGKEPDHMGAYQTTSLALEKLGLTEKAIQLLEQACLFNGQEEVIMTSLIDLYDRTGNLKKAEKYINQLLELNEEHEEALRWKAKLSGSSD